VDFKVEVPGTYILVDHSIFRAFNKGALGMLKVEGPGEQGIYSGKEVDSVYLADKAAAGDGGACVATAAAAKGQLTKEAAGRGRQVAVRRHLLHLPPADGPGPGGRVPAARRLGLPQGRPKRAIGVVLNGLTGPVKVNGKDYNSVMPPMSQLNDDEVANILTYVYNSWGNPGGVVSKGAASRLFVDENYLSHWGGARDLGAAGPAQPVTRVSWFAAKAYCEARGARLPTEREWELAALASDTAADADGDPAWRAQVLAWYVTPHTTLDDVGQRTANWWGVHDLHGLVWEWVYDFNAALVAIDSREKSEGDSARFCGAGSALAADTTDFAEFMRLAYRSSLEAAYSTNNLGFRCASDAAARGGRSP
jgi:sulfatase modifying factor 1